MSTYKALRKNPSAPQVDETVIAALRELPLAALSDNMHRNIGTVGLQPYHRPGEKTMAGTAVTARSRGGDNLTYLRALEFCRPGDVLVIDAGGDLANAVVGGILSFYADRIGLAGVVIDGAIRDVAEIREGLPVTRQGVTKHLLVLEDAGVVSARKEGRERLYTLEEIPLRQAREFLSGISAGWDRALVRLRKHVEGD